MDGDETDTVGFIALDGLLAKRLFPLCKESLYISGVLVNVVGQLVVEGTQVGTLTL